MLQQRTQMDKEALKAVLNGQWGTIGPKSIEGAKQLCSLTGIPFGVTTFSLTAALEALLRGMYIGYGDEVMVASYSDAADAMAAAAIGAKPVFADIDPNTCTLSVDSAKQRWSGNIKAVIADAPGGSFGSLKQLHELCRQKGAKLILNLQGSFSAALGEESLAGQADAVAVNLDDNLLCPGVQGGALLTADEPLFESAFAFHNCGRTFGEGCTLAFGEIIGGDLRIAEWQACLIGTAVQEARERLSLQAGKVQKLLEICDLPGLNPLSAARGGSALLFRYDREQRTGQSLQAVIDALRQNGLNASKGYAAMHRQPFFQSDYFRKLTGAAEDYSDNGLDCSLQAEEEVIWVTIPAER